jgi:hypothetical protein
VNEKNFEHAVVWHFTASPNDDEIYAYGTDFHAKQFCGWLNTRRKSDRFSNGDRFSYNEVATSEIPLIEHVVFGLREALYAQESSPSASRVSRNVTRKSIEHVLRGPSQDKAQLEGKILLVIDAIIEWNCDQSKKFAITQLLLERITRFNNLIIRDVLIKQQRAIDGYHTSLGWIEPPNNRSCGKKNFEALTDFVRGML